MKLFLTILLAIWLLPGAVIAGTSWEEKLADTWSVVYISNGAIQIGVAPDLSGRLVNLQLRRAGRNLLHLAPTTALQANRDSLSPLRPDLDYGGLQDVHFPAYPGLAFYGQPYKLQLNHDASAMTVTAQAEGVQLVRRMELLPDTTTLRVDVTLTNQRSQALDLMCRLRGEFDILPPGATAIQADKGWLVAMQPGSKTAMLLRFSAEQTQDILHAPAEDSDATVIDLLQRPRETAPGGTLSFRQEYSLYSGFTAIDLVHDATLMQLASPLSAYGFDEPVVVRVAAARSGPGEPFTAQVSLAGETRDLNFTCPTSGDAQWLTAKFPPFTEDGDYTVSLKAGDKTATHTIQVRGAQLLALRKQRTEAVENLGILLERGTLAKQTEAAMGQARLTLVDALLAARDLEQAQVALDNLTADITFWLGEQR